MASDNDSTRDQIGHRALNRRQLLGGSAAAAGAVALGGALPGLRGRAVIAQDGSAEFHSAWPYEVPPAGHFNLVQGVTRGIMLPNPTNIYADLIIQPMALYYWSTGEWLPLMATEWSFLEDGETFQVKLRQGAKWSDGAEFTSKDVLTTFWCARIMSNTIYKYVDTVTAVDDYTVNFHMSQPSTVVERYVLRFNIVSDVTYNDWSAQARALFEGGKTMDDPEGKQLLEGFTTFRPEDVIASGPFMFDVGSITNAQLTLVKNDQAWNAADVLFDRIVNYNGETPDVTPLVLAKDVDYATHGFPVATEKQMQESGIRVLRPPVYSGPALYFNYKAVGDAFGDKRARQALAMAIDRAQNGTVALAESGVPCEYMAGMSDNHVRNWMTEEDIAALNPYPYDQEAAAALLTEVGWTKDGDTWKTPAGENAEFELSFPAEFADWSAAGQNLAEQLTAFGIKISPRAVTHTQHPVDVNQGKFQLAIRAWGSAGNPHPHFSYTQDFFTHNTLAVNDGGEGMAFPLVQQTDVAGEVDLEQLTVDAADGLDEEAQRAKIGTVAKAFNELLPIIPLFERYGNNAAVEGERVEAWPADDDPLLQNSPYADGIVTISMLTGTLKPAAG